MNLLIAWILLTLPFVVLSTVFLMGIADKIEDEKERNETRKWLVILFLMLWWGIYFLIK